MGRRRGRSRASAPSAEVRDMPCPLARASTEPGWRVASPPRTLGFGSLVAITFFCVAGGAYGEGS